MHNARQIIRDAAIKAKDESAAEYDRRVVGEIVAEAKKLKAKKVLESQATREILSKQRGSSFGTVSSLVQNVYAGKFNDNSTTEDAAPGEKTFTFKVTTSWYDPKKKEDIDKVLTAEQKAKSKEEARNKVIEFYRNEGYDITAVQFVSVKDARSIIRDAADKIK